eukprot:CAMPEP_0194130240 /NCGR_PEP_ID=MMETSP0152-20130528/1316_1 /TAXON_ID=1049557 /ORGANISM="Thalassiothrix antarctica, Strain L6-D1" /LENGTH=336 /DNA_ID=CAMNT_0038824681 /DNA_START=73 /DNA_END=1083 /DNA_ORIENTATION=+
MAEPSNDELRDVIRKIVARVDLEMTGIKKFTRLLSKEFGGVNLSHKSKFVKRTLTEVINEDHDEESSSEGEDIEESEIEVEEIKSKPAKKRKASSPKGSASKAKKKGGNGGLSVVKEISDELATFLGKGKEMARTEIVSSMWEYIKENDLQNPENKREIILDDNMKDVFGLDVESFTMFTMNKYISVHIHPFKPLDLTTNTTKPKKRKLKTKDKKQLKKRKGVGLQAPYQLSPELSRVVNRQILPRPRVIKKLWEYIRENNLQDPDDRRTIICDAKFKIVMGGEETVTIFTMQKHITPHLLEKLDKSYYTPSDAEEVVEEEVGEVENDDDDDQNEN